MSAAEFTNAGINHLLDVVMSRGNLKNDAALSRSM